MNRNFACSAVIGLQPLICQQLHQLGEIRSLGNTRRDIDACSPLVLMKNTEQEPIFTDGNEIKPN